MIALIAKIFAALNANRRPGEVAAAFACGMLLGILPAGNLLWVGLFVVFFFFKMHLATMLLTIAFFKVWIGLTDPLLDRLGLVILEQPALRPFFTSVMNTPVLPFLRIDNSLVTGGLAAGIVLWVPFFFLGLLIVRIYRTTLRDKIGSSRLARFFEKTPILKKLTAAARKAGRVYGGWTG